MNSGLPLDPCALLRMDDWPDSADPFGDILGSFDPASPQALMNLLRDGDPLIARRGLFVFSELGQRAEIHFDAALVSVFSPDPRTRHYVVSGALSLTRSTSPQQLSRLLPLSNDPEDLVRYGMVALLGALELDLLQAGVQHLKDPVERFAHLAGLAEHTSFSGSSQSAFDKGLTASPLESTYILSSLERAARSEQNMAIPEYSGDSYIGNCALANIRRIQGWSRRNG